MGQARREGQKGSEDRAGDRPGQDYYETDVTLEELIDIMFEDLELPDMERKALRQIAAPRLSKRKGYRSVGIRVRLDKRRTVLAKLRRELASRRHRDPGAEAERFPFHEDDLTYRHVVADERRESNAAVICIMDTSGSMDTMKKYLARSFFFLLYQFIATKYRNVEIVFIGHHTEAAEVNEEEFFHKGESGGTFISAGYNKALEIVQERYHPSLWNIYCFHCSDGDNFESDNPGRAARRQGARGHLQPIRLWRDQTARLALLRELDAEHLPPPRSRQLPDDPHRAQGRHLAELQSATRQGPRQGNGRGGLKRDALHGHEWQGPGT